MRKRKSKSNHWVEDIPEEDDLEIEKSLPELPQLKKKSIKNGNSKRTNIHSKINPKRRVDN